MDIGYFLKLMTEKNASDMFLTTGAPVYIKIEGKLYPLGNTGLPSGMVKKIAYSLMDEGQVPQFERDLELNMAITAVPTDDSGIPNLDLTRAYAPTATDEQLLAMPSVLSGTSRDIADRLRALRDRYGVTYFTVQDYHGAYFAKAIAELR